MVNLRENHAKHCKARRAYALHKGLHVDQVTTEMVEGTPEGVDGWCDMVTTTSTSSVRPVSKQKPKAKSKARAGPQVMASLAPLLRRV